MEHILKSMRAWWRHRYSPCPPRRLMPSIGYWHTLMCLTRISPNQARAEERAWAEGTTRRWLAGDKM